MRPLMCEGRTPPMELQDRSGQMLRPDQATASRQRAERSGKKSDARCGGQLDAAVRRVRPRVPREESSMSFKSKVTAAAATLTLVGGVGTAGALTAGTAVGGHAVVRPACINLFSYQFGTHNSPNYTVDVLRQGEKVGQPIILFRTANYDPALDWTVAFQGTVADFYAAEAGVAPRWRCTTLQRPGPRASRDRIPGVRERVRAVRRGVGPVPGRGRDRVPGRGRDAAAVRRVREHRVDPGLPGSWSTSSTAGTFR